MEPLNDSWEHRIVTLKAEVSQQQREDFEQHHSGQRLPIYSPQALIPQLDTIGKEGWELVSIQPVLIGINGDLAIIGDTVS